MTVDKTTESLNTTLLEMLSVSEAANKTIFISGGFAIDIAVGRLTRNHDDIDAHPLEVDISWWKSWFKSKGFSIRYVDKIKDHSKAFVAYSPDQSYHVDMFGVKLNAEGKLSSAEGGLRHDWSINPYGRERITATWQSHNVTIFDPVGILWLKRDTARRNNTELRAKDIQDIKLI